MNIFNEALTDSCSLKSPPPFPFKMEIRTERGFFFGTVETAARGAAKLSIASCPSLDTLGSLIKVMLMS